MLPVSKSKWQFQSYPTVDMVQLETVTELWILHFAFCILHKIRLDHSMKHDFDNLFELKISYTVIINKENVKGKYNVSEVS